MMKIIFITNRTSQLGSFFYIFVFRNLYLIALLISTLIHGMIYDRRAIICLS